VNAAEAKQLLDAATPGPWDLVTCGFRGRSVGYTVSQQSSGRDIFEGPEGEQAICDAGDAALIAAAPDLAATVIELEAEVERLRSEAADRYNWQYRALDAEGERDEYRTAHASAFDAALIAIEQRDAALAEVERLKHNEFSWRTSTEECLIEIKRIADQRDALQARIDRAREVWDRHNDPLRKTSMGGMCRCVGCDMARALYHEALGEA